MTMGLRVVVDAVPDRSRACTARPSEDIPGPSHSYITHRGLLLAIRRQATVFCRHVPQWPEFRLVGGLRLPPLQPSLRYSRHSSQPPDWTRATRNPR